MLEIPFFILYTLQQICRCDGIGRRSGLKIHRWQHRAGSSPATGTKSEQTALTVFSGNPFGFARKLRYAKEIHRKLPCAWVWRIARNRYNRWVARVKLIGI